MIYELRCPHLRRSGEGCDLCGDVVPSLSGERPWWTTLWRITLSVRKTGVNRLDVSVCMLGGCALGANVYGTTGAVVGTVACPLLAFAFGWLSNRRKRI